jgi:hypothetical protein
VRPDIKAVVIVERNRFACWASDVDTAQNKMLALPSLAAVVHWTCTWSENTATCIGVHVKSAANVGLVDKTPVIKLRRSFDFLIFPATVKSIREAFVFAGSATLLIKA